MQLPPLWRLGTADGTSLRHGRHREECWGQNPPLWLMSPLSHHMDCPCSVPSTTLAPVLGTNGSHQRGAGHCPQEPST